MGRNIIYELYARWGESIWLDNLSRNLIDSGRLDELIEVGVRGVTTNPTIFEKAISGSRDYDTSIRQLASSGIDTDMIYDELTVKDVKEAAHLFHKVYMASGGDDGYVSLEVSPHLAFDTAGTVAEAKRLHAKVGVENVMFKIPATPQGIDAVEELIGEGININVTLIFSRKQYLDTVEAYIRGVQRLLDKGNDASKVFSVASVFVSRVDTMVDGMLDKLIIEEENRQRKDLLESFKGKAAVANARLIYREYLNIFYGSRFEGLRTQGARRQRLLWGSTSTKNPAYSDTKYVEELLGRDVVNTIPEKTIVAFLDHGRIGDMDYDFTASESIIDNLKKEGIDIDDVCLQLMGKGIKAFVESFDSLLAAIKNKASSHVSIEQ